MLRFASTDGVEVAAYDLGGDGPPMLLAHATGLHAHVWLPLAERLADHFHCYAYDARFHGSTSVPDGVAHDWQGLSDDALAVVEGLGLAGAVVGVGHSAGGAAVLGAEADRPGAFTALYCFEPIVPPAEVPSGPAANPLSEGARRRREVFSSRDEAYANYASKPPWSTLASEALLAYVDHGFEDLPDATVRLLCRRDHEAALFAMSFAHSVFARLPRVACPVTLVCGEDTDAITPAHLARQAERLPNARTEVMAGLGHFGPLEDPDAVAHSVLGAVGQPQASG